MIDIVRIDYGDIGGEIDVERGKDFVIIREEGGEHPATWSTRSGTVEFADGTEHEAVLDFCDSDPKKPYRVAIWVDEGLVQQEDVSFLRAVGKTKERAYPYQSMSWCLG